MQPSMGTLNSPSWRVVKNSTPSRCRILRCLNFGIGESSPNLFLNMVNLYLVRFEAQWSWTNGLFIVLLFSLFESETWPRKKQINLVNFHPTLFFAAVNLDPIVKEKGWTDGESWPNDFVEKVNRGEDLRWVGSRCPLTRALSPKDIYTSRFWLVCENKCIMYYGDIWACHEGEHL